ncbi:MAG: apolipoprotein N-acyltransferase, partial [Planctomycetota bacterium]
PASPFVAILGLALWAMAAGRTGPRRKSIEWCAGAVVGAGIMSWVAYITPPSVAWIGCGWGLYYILAGTLLRRLRHHCGLPLAAALAYTAVESLRAFLPTPFGLSWIRVGHFAAESEPLIGIAGLFGVGGMGFLFAALGGLLAQFGQAAIGLKSGHSIRDGGLPRLRDAYMPLGLLLLAVAFTKTSGFGTSPNYEQDFEDGPRVLLVQPGIPQERKKELNNSGNRTADLVNLQTALSLAGVFREAEAGTPVDLVCWGETMLPGVFVHPGLESAQSVIEPGNELEWPEWDLPLGGSGARISELAYHERNLIADLREPRFFGEISQEVVELLEGIDVAKASASLHETAFAAGAILYTEEDGSVRRTNAAMMWNADGERTGSGWKRHLVPGAETLGGLENWGWARKAALYLMPYTPDFRGATETGILRVENKRGSWKAGAAICFDNGFEDVFLEGAVLGGADFNLVLSNEAWYQESQEFDQMMAMSSLWAASSGRAIARATNSGISALVGPSGREVGRLWVEGKDRAVTGTVAFTVPVPKDSAAQKQTLYAKTFPLWNALWILGPMLLIGLRELFGGRPVDEFGAADKS